MVWRYDPCPSRRRHLRACRGVVGGGWWVVRVDTLNTCVHAQSTQMQETTRTDTMLHTCLCTSHLRTRTQRMQPCTNASKCTNLRAQTHSWTHAYAHGHAHPHAHAHAHAHTHAETRLGSVRSLPAWLTVSSCGCGVCVCMCACAQARAWPICM